MPPYVPLVAVPLRRPGMKLQRNTPALRESLSCGVSAASDVGGLFTVALRRRVKAYYFWLTRNFCCKCVHESFFVLSSDAELLLAVQVQQVAQSFSEVIDRVDGQLYPEMRRVWVCDRDLQHDFLAAL